MEEVGERALDFRSLNAYLVTERLSVCLDYILIRQEAIHFTELPQCRDVQEAQPCGERCSTCKIDVIAVAHAMANSVNHIIRRWLCSLGMNLSWTQYVSELPNIVHAIRSRVKNLAPSLNFLTNLLES